MSRWLIASTESELYSLCKQIDKLIKNHYPVSEYVIKDAFDLFNKMEQHSKESLITALRANDLLKNVINAADYDTNINKLQEFLQNLKVEADKSLIVKQGLISGVRLEDSIDELREICKQLPNAEYSSIKKYFNVCDDTLFYLERLQDAINKGFKSSKLSDDYKTKVKEFVEYVREKIQEEKKIREKSRRDYYKKK